jgi:hypothetical protein
MPDFMEVIFVQLTNKAGEITVFEVFGEDGLGELLVLFPGMLEVMFHLPSRARTSSTTKLSPSALHRTTELYEGSSSILQDFR